MSLTEQEIADLRKKAEAATPGRWFAEFYAFYYDIQAEEGYGKPSVLRERCEDDEYELGVSPDKAKANAAFIAASNPATILGLLDDRDRMAAEIARLRADAEWRPISTAPRDGTEIDVLIDACERYTNVAYENGEWWIETYDKAFGDVRIAIRRQLTHWRPLPQPPEAS